MKALVLIAALLSVIGYFFVLYKSLNKKECNFSWIEMATHIYLVFMILTLAFIGRNIF